MDLNNRDTPIPPRTKLLIYDGDCGFCTQTANWVNKKTPEEVTSEPWQSLDLAKYRLSEKDVSGAAYWVDENLKTFRGHLAVGKALQEMNSFYKLIGYTVFIPPFSWIAKLIYKLVAKYRYRLPGSTDACKIN